MGFLRWNTAFKDESIRSLMEGKRNSAEGHVPVGLKQAREVVGGDAKLAGDRITGYKIPIKATIFRFPAPTNA
jgi:hypothetical protein